MVSVFALAKSVLKPSARSLALFMVFVFICIGGVIQTYAFIDDIPGVEKPPLYDQLSVLELWFPWILLAAPVHLLGDILDLWWLLELFPSLGFRVPLASIAYSYILSCWTIYSWNKWVKYSRMKKYLVFVAITVSLMMSPLPVLFSPPVTLADISRFISGFVSILLVTITYIVSLIGLVRVLKIIIMEFKKIIGQIHSWVQNQVYAWLYCHKAFLNVSTKSYFREHSIHFNIESLRYIL